MLCYFNGCKKQNDILSVFNVTFGQQPIWNNELFVKSMKAKLVFFKVEIKVEFDI